MLHILLKFITFYLNMNNKKEINELEKKLNRLLKKADGTRIPLDFHELILISFENIAKSKRKCIKFLKEAGIFNEEGHLSDEYK